MSLFDDASLVLTPNGYKASKLYSIKPTSGLGDMTVVRATTATRVNSAGLIESVAINVPRLDYTGGGCPKILVEPLRTNLVLQSGDLSQSVWSKTNYALTSATSIQGLTTTRITKNSTNNGDYSTVFARNVFQNVSPFAVGFKTISFLIRKGNTDKVGFGIDPVLVGALTQVFCQFNFTNQTFTNVSLGLTASFENPITDVYKIILTFNEASAPITKTIFFAPIDNSNNTVTGGYLDVAFVQAEAGSNATSYIPTTISALARNADSFTLNNIYTNGLLSASGGTWFVDLRNNIPLTRDVGSVGLNLDTSLGSNGFAIRNNAAAQRLTISKYISNARSDIYLTTTNTCKIAIKWNGTTADIFENGTKVVSATSFTPTAMQVINGISTDVSKNINQMSLWATPLTDPQCIDLTN